MRILFSFSVWETGTQRSSVTSSRSHSLGLTALKVDLTYGNPRGVFQLYWQPARQKWWRNRLTLGQSWGQWGQQIHHPGFRGVGSFCGHKRVWWDRSKNTPALWGFSSGTASLFSRRSASPYVHAERGKLQSASQWKPGFGRLRKENLVGGILLPTQSPGFDSSAS